MSTTDFIQRFTTEGGAFLKWDRKGVCVFLDSNGCSVHPDRPLVCRLYPLGRHIRNSGEESFSEIEPDPECKGVYGEDGMIMDYLGSQGAEPFIAASKRYLDLFWRLHQMLMKNVTEPETDQTGTAILQAAAERTPDGSFMTDMDAAVTQYCRKTKTPFPKGIEERMSVHIEAVEAWANNL